MAYSKAKRRAYQRKYYRDHIEEAKEYQRIYKRTHPMKRKRPRNVYVEPRPEKQISFTSGDLLRMPTRKFVKVYTGILEGARVYVG